MGDFENPRRAAAALRAISAALGTTEVERFAREASEPDRVVAAFERTAPAIRAADATALIAPLARLFESSELAVRLVARRPGLLRWAARGFRGHSALVLRGLDFERAQRRLRRHKYAGLFRIAWQDVLDGTPAHESGRALTELANRCVGAALQWCQRVLPAAADGICIVGMGKLGGGDLNFSSDLDLLFVFRGEGPPYAKLAETLTRLLAAQTADGFAYRVDLNLRPNGRIGAIALSLAATLGYYETLGRTWERAAWTKARVIAGDAGLGEELLEAMAPFVWRRSLDLGAVDALRDLKAQIDVRGKASALDVKLGPGGIREVEFFVTALQLLHGGKDASLRDRNTLKALRRLELGGHVTTADAEALEAAYLFLRRVENHLQLFEERQTQTLPTAPTEQLRLARSLGLADAAALQQSLSSHRAFVQRAFSTLLGQTARDEVPDEPLLALALDLEAAAEARTQALTDRGFQDPAGALGSLERLSRVPGVPFSGQPGSLGGALRLMAEIARTADPDQALAFLAELISHLTSPTAYLELLARFPQVRRRVLNLFGQSEYLSRTLLRHPELIDGLVQGLAEDPRKDPDRIRAELSQRAYRYEDPEERLGALRRFKNEEVLRIGLHDIHDELAVPEVAAQLTAIAEGVLDQCLFLAESELRRRHGDPGAPLTVIALGKLGGRELGYHSDLDLIFVYGGGAEGESAGGERPAIPRPEYFAKLAQRLISLVQLQFREGVLYRIDARLRPSGNQGTLVVSARAFTEHHQHRAQLWERQALIKARAAAGDPALFARLEREVIHPLVYDRPLPPDAFAEIARLRERMEQELARESRSELDLKTGRGGLVDIEFAAQALQLRHRIRTPNTLEAIALLTEAGHLSSGDAATLRLGYLFHRRVENRLRLVHGRSLSRFPTGGRPLEALARRLGYSTGATFLDDYRSYAAKVREVYSRVLSGGT